MSYPSCFKDFATSVALKAGKIMKQNFTAGINVGGIHKEWKEDNSPLTETDLAVNNLVIEEVRRNFPGHGIIGEEECYFNKEEYVWVCDPVDGTNPFSHGYPLFTFSLALVHQGRPILGLLYDPILDRLLVAESGRGARLNNKPIKVSESSSWLRLLVALESNQYQFNKVRQDLVEAGCVITSFACITYSSLLVAIGEFAAVVWYGKSPWDGAAVQIIIEEAGGVCTDINGTTQRYDREINGIVASNKELHPKLIEIIKSSYKN